MVSDILRMLQQKPNTRTSGLCSLSPVLCTYRLVGFDRSWGPGSVAILYAPRQGDRFRPDKVTVFAGVAEYESTSGLPGSSATVQYTQVQPTGSTLLARPPIRALPSSSVTDSSLSCGSSAFQLVPIELILPIAF